MPAEPVVPIGTADAKAFARVLPKAQHAHLPELTIEKVRIWLLDEEGSKLARQPSKSLRDLARTVIRELKRTTTQQEPPEPYGRDESESLPHAAKRTKLANPAPSEDGPVLTTPAATPLRTGGLGGGVLPVGRSQKGMQPANSTRTATPTNLPLGTGVRGSKPTLATLVPFMQLISEFWEHETPFIIPTQMSSYPNSAFTSVTSTFDSIRDPPNAYHPNEAQPQPRSKKSPDPPFD